MTNFNSRGNENAMPSTSFRNDNDTAEGNHALMPSLTVVHSMLDLRSAAHSNQTDDDPTTPINSALFNMQIKSKQNTQNSYGNDNASVTTTRSSTSLKISDVWPASYGRTASRRHSDIGLLGIPEGHGCGVGTADGGHLHGDVLLSPRQTQRIFARYQPGKKNYRPARDRYGTLPVVQRELLLDNEESFHSLLSEMRNQSGGKRVPLPTEVSLKEPDESDSDDSDVSEGSEDDLESFSASMLMVYDAEQMQLAREACLAKAMKSIQTTKS